MESDLWMVVGLGNPGERYQNNRHNIGFFVADHLGADPLRWAWRGSRRFSAEVARGGIGGGIDLLLVKPQTYMNLSGEAVGGLAHFYDIPPQRVVAIHDDADLDLGRLKVKRGGGDGGHRGIRSMAQHLGDPGFFRLRCGIGRPGQGGLVQFVLGDFHGDEQEAVADLVARAAEAVLCVVLEGLQAASNKFNAPTNKSLAIKAASE